MSNLTLIRLMSLAALAVGGIGAQPQAFMPLDPFEQVKEMGRGVNILGYDPLWNDTAKARFHERHSTADRSRGY